MSSFNSIKVQLERLYTEMVAWTDMFQFHKGSIRTFHV